MITVTLEEATKIAEMVGDIQRSLKKWKKAEGTDEMVTVLDREQIEFIGELPPKVKDMFRPLVNCPAEELEEVVQLFVEHVSAIQVG